jgi:hypothetical protein
MVKYYAMVRFKIFGFSLLPVMPAEHWARRFMPVMHCMTMFGTIPVKME